MPDQSNGYQLPSWPPTKIDRALWNGVMANLDARLKAREALEATFEILQEQGVQAALDYIQVSVAPQLSALQQSIANAQSAIDLILGGNAPNAQKLGGQLPSYYAKAQATAESLGALAVDISLLNTAIGKKLNKAGDSMSSVLKLAFDYAQLWWGDALTGTGWRIIKDTPEGQVGTLVFQCSTDRWVDGAKMKTAMYLGADGVAHFESGVQIKTNDLTFGPGAGGKLSKLQANGDVMLNRGDNSGYLTWNTANAYFGWDGTRYGFGPAGPVVCNGYFQVDDVGLGVSAQYYATGDTKFSGYMAADLGPYLSTVIKGFKSGNQPYVTNGLGSVGHGLGRKPSKLSFYLVCTTAANGWAVGDEIEIGAQLYVAGNPYGITFWADATNIYWKVAAQGIAIINKSTGQAEQAFTANYALRFRGAM